MLTISISQFSNSQTNSFFQFSLMFHQTLGLRPATVHAYTFCVVWVTRVTAINGRIFYDR